jgi:hypothetical protein
MKKIVWWIILAILVLIQFIPYGITNEAHDAENDFFAHVSADPAMVDLVHAACYDCHSQEAKKPWYAYVAPVKFWVNLHVRGARQHVDFSNWGQLSADKKSHKMDECAEMVGNGEMPLKSYTLMHSEARLSDDQRQELIAFFERLK